MSYTKLGIVSAIIFLIIIVLFNFLLALVSKDSLAIIIDNMLSAKYILTRLIFAVFYGFFMVFLFKRKEKKLFKK